MLKVSLQSKYVNHITLTSIAKDKLGLHICFIEVTTLLPKNLEFPREREARLSRSTTTQIPSFRLHTAHSARLIQALGRAHGGLDGKRSDVLPALLEEGDEVVDGQHDVADQLILGHANVADGDTHAEHLLQLELDGGLDVVHLALEILGVRDGGRELASLGETGAEETGDLLDEGVRGQEGVVLAGELLDQLLVLVQLLQVVGGHGVDAEVLSTIDLGIVSTLL